MTAISSNRQRAASRLAAAFTGALAFAATASATEYAVLQPYAGSAPASIDARDLEGRPFGVAADPERVTLVHFFASWCEPCEQELPGLVAFLRDHEAEARLVGVAVGEPASRAKKFADRFALPGPVASDPDKNIAKAFGVRGLPATIAIAPAGRAALAATGEIDWAAARTRDAVIGLKRQEH